MDEQTKTTQVADIKYDSVERILQVVFKPMTVEQEHAEEVVKTSGELTRDDIHANLVDMRKAIYITDPARKYFAGQDKSTVLAIGVVLDSRIQTAFGNFYMRFSKPIIPTKLFTDTKQAIDWLKETIAEKQLEYA